MVSVKEIIRKIRVHLENHSESILVGQVRMGNTNISMDHITVFLSQYAEFLKECDGASFGEIDLFPSSEVGKNQFYVETLQGGNANWFFIGLVLYEPIVINKHNGNVYRYYRDMPENIPQECFGTFDEFLINYAFGNKYTNIVPTDESDEWLNLLRDLNLI